MLMFVSLFFVTTSVVAPPPPDVWIDSTVSTEGDVGLFSSLALDSSDQPHISYYDSTNGDLRFVSDVGDAWHYETVDTIGMVGLLTSLALDSGNRAHISYFDSTNNDLKYATDAGGLWDAITIDGVGDIGSYSSIAIDSANKVHISYYDMTNGNLKYATNAGGSWTTTTVDSVDDVGTYNSLALDSHGRAHISYYDATNYDLKYANNAEGSWNIAIIDGAGDVGTYSSIAIDSANKVHIAYSDNTNSDLKYANNVGGTWSWTTIDASGFTGSYASLALDSSDQPHISYYDSTNGDLRYATWDGTWYTSTIDSDGIVGWFTSIAIDSSGRPHISYYDASNADLKYASEVAVPTAPQNLQATAGDESVELSWTAPAYTGPGTITYHLYRDGTEIFSGFALTFQDGLLTNGVEYSYAVAAVNSVGWGPNSTEVKATPSGGATIVPPSAPTGLTAAAGDSYVQLEWELPSSPGPLTIVYHLFRDGALIWSSMALNYNDTAAVNGVTYTYTVAAQSNAGWSPNSTAVTATPNAVQDTPGVPQDLQAVAGDGQVALTWSAPSGSGSSAITGYKVYRGTSSGSLAYTATVNGTTYTDSGLTNGQEYRYQVSAVNAAGEGAPTPEVTATPSSASTSIFGSIGDLTMALLIVGLVAAVGVLVFLLYRLRRKRPS